MPHITCSSVIRTFPFIPSFLQSAGGLESLNTSAHPRETSSLAAPHPETIVGFHHRLDLPTEGSSASWQLLSSRLQKWRTWSGHAQDCMLKIWNFNIIIVIVLKSRGSFTKKLPRLKTGCLIQSEYGTIARPFFHGLGHAVLDLCGAVTQPKDNTHQLRLRLC